MEYTGISRKVHNGNGNGGPPDAAAKEIHVEIEFKLIADQANAVTVAGNFNHWDPTSIPLKRVGDCWKATLLLPRGDYEYRFVVDGCWMCDPGAPQSVSNPFGSGNSVLNV